MFWDLNVAYPANKTDQKRIIETAMELGYDGIVFSQTITERFTNKIRNTMTPIDLNELSKPPLRQSSVLRLAASVTTPYQLITQTNNQAFNQSTEQSNSQPVNQSNDSRRRSAFQQKFRLNLEIADVAAVNALPANNQNLNQWDIVAIKTSAENVFAASCALDCIDILMIDCAVKLPFHLKRPTINLGVQNGLHFELAYNQSINDPGARRYLFASALQLNRVCPSAHIVFSSGYESNNQSINQSVNLRSAYDLINVLRLMGFNERESIDCLNKNPETALWHGETRRTSKAAVRVTKTSNQSNNQSNDQSNNQPKRERGDVDNSPAAKRARQTTS